MSTTNEDLRKEIKEFRESLEREIRRELRDIKSSMTFVNQQFEELREEVKAARAENKSLKEENARLQSKCKDLAESVRDNSLRILRSEQYSRNANIEIKNIPPQTNENLHNILKDIGEKLGEPINANDIEVCHRVPVANSPSNKNIVVQFVHRAKRNAVLEKARRFRLKGTDIGLTTDSPFYVNEHLCPELKRLLGKATAKKRQAGWNFLWVRNGQIFARKTESSAVLAITSEEDLSRMVAGTA